jgi:hypothetical protein
MELMSVLQRKTGVSGEKRNALPILSDHCELDGIVSMRLAHVSSAVPSPLGSRRADIICRADIIS